MNFLLVGLGGLIGSVLRYGISLWMGATALSEQRLPWATLTVNIAGALLLGLLAGCLRPSEMHAGSALFLLLGTGLCGGFTTFSTFSLELIELFRDGSVTLAAIYLTLSLVLSAGAVFLGLFIANRI